MQSIILCGGLATRLGDATKSVPKVLLGQIQLLREADVKGVILASGHLYDVLHARVGTHYADVSVQYAKEEKRLGTGGAIQNAMQHVTTSPFFLLNGDVLLAKFSPQEMLGNFYHNMAGLLLSVQVPDIRPYGEVVSNSDGKITAFHEKQSTCRAGYINSGVYLFNRRIADAFPTDRGSFSIERDVFPNVHDLYTLQADADWIDIGIPERLAHARQHFRNGDSQ